MDILFKEKCLKKFKKLLIVFVEAIGKAYGKKIITMKNKKAFINYKGEVEIKESSAIEFVDEKYLEKKEKEEMELQKLIKRIKKITTPGEKGETGKK